MSRDDPATRRLSSLEALQESSVPQPQIVAWLSDEGGDLHHRLASQQYFFSGVPSSSSPTQYPRSIRTTSSMAPTQLHQASNTSAYAPSLQYSECPTATESSVSTGLASRFSGVPLLEEVNGVLERRPNQIRPPVYECSFWFLSCNYLSTDEEEWRTHCLSHFRGEEPPKSVQCPLCEDFSYTYHDGWVAWDHRMDHLAFHHQVGQGLRTSRPDFHLFHHLWQKRLIDDADVKELKGGNHNLTRPPSNYTTTGGRVRRGGQRQRAQHVGSGRYGRQP